MDHDGGGAGSAEILTLARGPTVPSRVGVACVVAWPAPEAALPSEEVGAVDVLVAVEVGVGSTKLKISTSRLTISGSTSVQYGVVRRGSNGA